VTTVAGEEGSEGSKLGVYLSIDAQLPLDISFNLENVGGPSAGMMFMRFCSLSFLFALALITFCGSW